MLVVLLLLFVIDSGLSGSICFGGGLAVPATVSLLLGVTSGLTGVSATAGSSGAICVGGLATVLNTLSLLGVTGGLAVSATAGASVSGLRFIGFYGSVLLVLVVVEEAVVVLLLRHGGGGGGSLGITGGKCKNVARSLRALEVVVGELEYMVVAIYKCWCSLVWLGFSSLAKCIAS